MICKKMITRTFLIGPVLAAIIGAGVLVGCTGDTGPEGGRDSGSATATQEISEGAGGESGGEHSGGGEGSESGGEGTEGSESGSGGEEGSGAANMLALDETFDMVRGGARLILSYDAPSNSFKGTVENTTNGVLSQVRIEVHLSNGVELGPTTPRDMAPGEVVSISMPATAASFTGWTPHAEVGGGEGSESGGEGGAETGEAAMSSPIIPLGESWSGVLGGLAASMQYDAATQTVHGTVRNTLSQELCYVQAEPHLKSGATTVGELGPEKLGDLNPGQEAATSLSVAGEPGLAGVSYDGYVMHLEVFDCAGPGPVPHTGGEGGEQGSGESGTESGSESGGEGAEGGGESGGESGGAGSEEGSANMLAPDETFDAVRGGARLILSYDAPSSSFKGTVENTTNGVLDQVRIEVHLSNGVELGPTTPRDMAPGEVVSISMPATQASFTGWVAHAEVGSGSEGSGSGGESGGEGSGGEGSESGGEGGAETGEAAMSSPIIPLGESWSGVLGGLAASMQYDAATQTVHGTVQNTLSQKLCYVQAEPHLKSGATTVGELGPEKLGDLNPGQEAATSLSVAGEPGLAGVSYDGYVMHLEVFDCAGPGPVPHTGGEGGEQGSGESGTESGSESGGSGEEGSANMLAPDETFDAVRGGARLILSYDAPSNSFKGTVENTTNGVLDRVRIEVHLSNGTELGPTTPRSLAPGEILTVTLPATQASFTGWVAHAEVGSGSEGSGSGGESGGEHGGSGGESGGEHGSGGERRGGG